MQLELFVGSVREGPTTASGLCRAVDVPGATGHRWIEMLEARGLVRRRTVWEDSEMRLVEISDSRFEAMRQDRLEGVTKFEMPLPD